MEQLLWPERLSFLRRNPLRTLKAHTSFMEGGPARSTKAVQQGKTAWNGGKGKSTTNDKRRSPRKKSISRSRGIRIGEVRRSRGRSNNRTITFFTDALMTNLNYLQKARNNQ